MATGKSPRLYCFVVCYDVFNSSIGDGLAMITLQTECTNIYVTITSL